MLNFDSLVDELKELLHSPRSPVCFDDDDDPQLTCDVNNATLSVHFRVGIDENMGKFYVGTFNQTEGIWVESECFETAEREKVLRAAREFKSKYIEG